MKVMIVYDSVFGNTEKIATAVGGALGGSEPVVTIRAGEVKPEQLAGIELLIVGSPTRGFRPTEAIRAFLKAIPTNSLKGVRVAAFDTRIALEDVKSPILNIFVKIFGYAAKPIAGGLTAKGGSLGCLPEGFFVKASEGPLKEGELERAAAWAKTLR